jgi:hypothetical protein
MDDGIVGQKRVGETEGIAKPMIGGLELPARPAGARQRGLEALRELVLDELGVEAFRQPLFDGGFGFLIHLVKSR